MNRVAFNTTALGLAIPVGLIIASVLICWTIACFMGSDPWQTLESVR